jgi:Mg2+ and Co2+ transporter CorA
VYSLLDAVVDGYFPILESFGERLRHLEDEIIARPSQHGIRPHSTTLSAICWLLPPQHLARCARMLHPAHRTRARKSLAGSTSSARTIGFDLPG